MNYATATNIAIADIPVIDVAPLYAQTREGLDKVAGEMRAAAERVGFFYVRNHGIPRELIARTEAASRAFFALPLEEKLAVKPTSRHRGFLRIGEAKMDDKAKVDLKESFIWGLDVADDDPDYRAGNRMIGPNHWPARPPGMRATLNEFFAAANTCGQMLLRGFAASLAIERGYFTRSFAKPISRGSLIYYPPQPPDAGEDQFGVAPHTDYGCITLLHQDNIGGLQVANRAGEWVTAHPVEDTLVINVGDLLARWTNDRFKSTPHRVVNTSGRARYSIAVFVDPDFDTPIEPVITAGEAPRYKRVGCGEYILGRFDSSFAYRK
ncbi:MAG: isopenicillin N synthase family oxygenase [Betaproteobacteria bacterium]|nr:isopenicillin N synthase family oxygenase [Betaproteobacteria bacterium]